MKMRILGALALALSLSACSSVNWNNWNYSGPPHMDAFKTTASMEVPAATEVPTAPASQSSTAETRCLETAAGDLANAQKDGFDEATQQRMAAISYRQCMEFGVGTTP
jgi:hypothetical protein